MAFERVPPRRAAGSRGRAPSLIRARQRLIRGPGQSPGAIFAGLAYGLRFVLGYYLQGLSVRASRIPSRLRGFEASGAFGELRNTFDLFHFLAFPLFFFFSLSFLLHYSRINLCTFLLRVPGFWINALALFLNYATRGRAGGARRAGLGCLL